MIAQSTLISYHKEAFVKTEVACTVYGCTNFCQHLHQYHRSNFPTALVKFSYLAKDFFDQLFKKSFLHHCFSLNQAPHLKKFENEIGQ